MRCNRAEISKPSLAEPRTSIANSKAESRRAVAWESLVISQRFRGFESTALRHGVCRLQGFLRAHFGVPFFALRYHPARW